jgi:uncharacterized protein YjbI with pentapeptide repeats
MKPGWKDLYYFGGAVATSLVLWSIITGRTGFTGKTLWDWMQLLIIPLFLAGGAYYLNKVEKDVEHDIAKDRQREEALQSYFDKMGNLLLKEKLRTTKNRVVRDFARTITLNVLRDLDADRKRQVIQFLYEANLINFSDPIVVLEGADLSFSNLEEALLDDANLRRVNFYRAKLVNASLRGATLRKASLKEADLKLADLTDAKLLETDLRSTNFTYSTLENAKLQFADFTSSIES